MAKASATKYKSVRTGNYKNSGVDIFLVKVCMEKMIYIGREYNYA